VWRYTAKLSVGVAYFIIFRVSRRRREMYIGHARLCVCNLGNGRGYPLVVHYLADLQSVHGFRCCDNKAPRALAIDTHDSKAANAKCQRVLALCLVNTIVINTSIGVNAMKLKRFNMEPRLK